jgi:hypothetical protein
VVTVGLATGLETVGLFKPVIGDHEYAYAGVPAVAVEKMEAVAPAQIVVVPFVITASCEGDPIKNEVVSAHPAVTSFTIT